MSTAARSPSGTRSPPRARACSRRCSTPSRTRSRRPGSPPSAWVAVTQWPSAWRCSDAGGHRRHCRSAAHAPPQRSRAARRSPRRPRGARGDRAHPFGWLGAALDSDRKRRECRTTRDAPVRDRRSAEAGHRDPGLATQRESVPRAPMTARVSFAARAKGTGAAVAWIVGFALVGGAASWALDQVRPHSDPRWWLAWGSLASVLGFGLAHLGNPGATAFSTLNVALAGVWLACAFFSPGGMPLGWGAHFGWNATLALGFAAPVSGYAFPLPAFEYRPGRHGWIDGGAFGPEGGIVSTLVMLAGTAALVAWSRTARTPEPAA